MANYINQEILCEAYSHLDIDTFKDKDALKNLEAEIRKFFEERAHFLFGNDIQILIEFEEGSLITKVTAIGSAAILIGNLIVEYGSFRQGVDQLAKDSVLLAQSTNLEMIFRTRTNYCDRVSVEKRKGVFGRTQELILALDGVKRHFVREELPTNLTGLEIYNTGLSQLLEWDRKADKLFSKLDSTDASGCIADGFLQELSSLPNQPPWSSHLNPENFKYRILAADPQLLSDVTAAASRYTVILKSIKEKMADRVKEATPKES